MITEADAKTKWCPNANMPFGHRDGYCIGSACMAWREQVEYRNNWSSSQNVKPPVPDDGWEPNGDVYATDYNLPQEERSAGGKQFCRSFVRRSGYCGAFGRPE